MPLKLDYSLLYSQFNLSTIWQIYSQTDAKIVFKLVRNLINSPDTIDGFRNRNLPHNLRSIHPLTVNSIPNNYSFYSSSNRLKWVWNLLPPEVRTGDLLHKFNTLIYKISLYHIRFTLQNNYKIQFSYYAHIAILYISMNYIYMYKWINDDRMILK